MSIYGFDDVATHAMMLVDAVRMRAFSEAITRTVRPGDVVVDVGSGSGILALLCAKAGARKVYALEHGPMAELITAAARDNGLADIVDVRRADARAVSFEPDSLPNVLISEMIGSFGLDEDFIGLMGDVAAKCVPGVRIVPRDIVVHLALADLGALSNEIAMLDGSLGVDLGAL